MGQRWIEANGVLLRYDLTPGPGAGTVVLVHEMGGTLDSWDAVAEPLSGFASVLRYDQRGVGLSEKPPGPVTIETMAADLAGLLDVLAITGPVAVAGTAVGAAIAAAFAALYPERADALLMLGPATNMSPDRRGTAMARIEALERHGLRAAFADVVSDAPARFATLRLTADPEGLGAIWRMLADLDMTSLLPRIACPTLVAAATRDIARPLAHVAGVAGQIPGARLVAIETTHYMAIEAPMLVLDTIVSFLRACGFR